MRKRFALFVILAALVFLAASPAHAQCQTQFSMQAAYIPFDGGIAYIVGPNTAGDYLVVGFMSETSFSNLSTVPAPNVVNNKFCDTVPLIATKRYFAYVPTLAEHIGDFSAFTGSTNTLLSDPETGSDYAGGIITDLPGKCTGCPTINSAATGVMAWRIPAGEPVFVSTGLGGQILKVDGNIGGVTIVSKGPCKGCSFNPTGAVVGPDSKIYVTDQVNSNIWRMNQDGSQPEMVYNGSACSDSGPCAVEGPSFSASGTGDLYFNTWYNGGVFVIAGVGTTAYGETSNVPASVSPSVPGGTGTAFDANGNLLAGDVESETVWTIPPPYTAAPATLINSATTPIGTGAPAGIALNKLTGQIFVADPSASEPPETQINGILQVIPPAAAGQPYTTTSYYAFNSTSSCGGPDQVEYMQFDMTGHLFATTSTMPISLGHAGSYGCGKVWRIDPTAPPTATLLVDLNSLALFHAGLTTPQAIGLALPPTAGPTQPAVPLSPTGGTYSVGMPFGCTPTQIPPNNCSSTITGVYPPGIYSTGDTMNITFNEVSQAQYASRVAGTAYSATTLAPVAGWNGDGIVPSLVCLNSSGNPCDDPVTPGTSYEIFTTWQSNQTGYCGLTPHLLRGDPVGGPYTFLVDTIIGCTDGGVGTRGKSGCTSSSSSSCASDWPNSFGAVTTSTAGVTATATITWPPNGANFMLNQPETATFACGQTPGSPSIVVSCPGLVTNPAYPNTVLSVTSGRPLPTSLLGTSTLSVNPNVNGGSAGTGASVTYAVVACHYVSLAFNPDPVAAGKFTAMTATVESCTGTRQKNVVIGFTLKGPFGKSCGTAQTPVLQTPPFTLSAYTDTFKFPLWIPKGACAGTYTVTAQTYVSGTLVDTSSGLLIVTAH
jgi:hypothetical protein